MVDFRSEIVVIKKMVVKLYKRSVVIEPVVETVIPIVEVPNIWAEPANGKVEETKE